MGHLVWLAVIFSDQLTKYLILTFLEGGKTISVFPGFNLILTYNPGVSFSMLSFSHAAMPYVLSVLALAIAAYVFIWMLREKDVLLRLGLALVFGGAIANVLDRLRFKAVVDFLDFYIGPYHWPAFNVADTAICAGAALILFKMLFQKKEGATE